MEFCFNELLLAVSYALDFIEQELVGVTTNHSRRVACISILMGKGAGLSKQELSDLAGCALLHDNALTEYIQTEYLNNGKGEENGTAEGIHCSLGERNIAKFPFFGDVSGAILYHHENADGSGPFGMTENEIPLYAGIIHLADKLDSIWDLNKITEAKYGEVCDYLKQNTGILFSAEDAALFLDNAGLKELRCMSADGIRTYVKELLPSFSENYVPQQIMDIAELFARITDYKSTFTSRHSIGLAQKAYQMGVFYGYSEEERAKLYLAGALHDIGKLAVDTQILEKEGKLTEEEFEEIKRHARVSYEILSEIQGFEEIASWGGLHHEKLNGRGYPFGYTGKDLGFHERLMACLDIYQALEEKRPYKKEKSHSKIMEILRQMAADSFIDAVIVEDLECLDKEKA